MLDIKKIRQNPQLIEKKLQTKDDSISLTELLAVDSQRLDLLTFVETQRSQANKLSKEVGLLKSQGQDATALKNQVVEINQAIADSEVKLKELTLEWNRLQSLLPNIPLDEIPASLNPDDKVIIYENLKNKKPLDQTPLNHLEINEKFKFFDFSRATKTSGSGFVCYRGLGAQLEFALLQFMIQFHLQNGYLFCLPPHVAKDDVFYGCGQLPKFADQLYKLDDDEFALRLIPTSEAIVNGLHQDEIFHEKNLPLKYVAYSPCFRREAGASGTQERGLIRMHQFNKVEMFAFSTPDKSEEIFQEFVANAQKLLELLELPYQSALLSSGDISFGAEKTVDVEVWLPGQKMFREVSSVSRCGDFQGRRANIRYRKDDSPISFVHTLNGSGLATSRVMVALLENHQQSDGSIYIPEVLRPYLNGKTYLTLSDVPPSIT